MTFVDSIKTCLTKYVGFEGRATRSEYWWFYLFFIIVYVVLALLSNALSSVFVLVPIIGFILPAIAAATRRLHDTGRTGWWQLISFVPFVGAIVMIVFLVLEGNPGDNQYGPPPAK
jgi:uncharacterized membrane protein YhaH (DUF805 family)